MEAAAACSGQEEVRQSCGLGLEGCKAARDWRRRLGTARRRRRSGLGTGDGSDAMRARRRSRRRCLRTPWVVMMLAVLADFWAE
ncbi:hypothetical protein M0R45_009041 [Rubus argutus]|uniref:Uncharacterized protein n=1 Tax=Rubus argutus TaxID=59490 RepID=A0AAW1Y3C7_RUBAR